MLIISRRARPARAALLDILHQTMPALFAARREPNINSCVADGRSSGEMIEGTIPSPKERSNQIRNMDTWRVTSTRKRSIAGMWRVIRRRRVTKGYAGVQARLITAEK